MKNSFNLDSDKTVFDKTNLIKELQNRNVTAKKIPRSFQNIPHFGHNNALLTGKGFTVKVEKLYFCGFFC
jgi:hypothetical protein